MNIDYKIQNDMQSNIHGDVVGLNEDDIINFDNMLVGYIYIKKIWEKYMEKEIFCLEQ